MARGGQRGGSDGTTNNNLLLERIRIVPASPSYFTATPRYTDDLLALSTLLRKHLLLPQLPRGHAPRIAWKTWGQYKAEVDEPVKETRYKRLLEIIKRLNYIHPALVPEEVTSTLARFKRTIQPYLNQPKPILIDKHGRTKTVGRRKSSTATVYVVEGTGEVMVNGKSLTEYFGRLHDRESAVWAMKSTERLDKYNVWAVAQGGGTTGQAEAVMLAVAKGLLAHEPDLKTALRRGESSTSSIQDWHERLLTHYCSRHNDTRPQACGEEEGRQAEGPQDARLGQALSAKRPAQELLCYYVHQNVLHTHFPSIAGLGSHPEIHPLASFLRICRHSGSSAV